MDDKQVSKTGRWKTFPVEELQCRDAACKLNGGNLPEKEKSGTSQAGITSRGNRKREGRKCRSKWKAELQFDPVIMQKSSHTRDDVGASRQAQVRG